jgi:hypothetical protein
MQEFLFGTWSPQIIAYSQKYPWRVFAIVLVGILVLDLILRKDRSRGDGGDFGGFDWGDGGGDGGGD